MSSSEKTGAGKPQRGLADVMLWIASLALGIMMLVVVADVLLRFVFKTPVRGAYDVVSIGLLVMVFFGIASVVARASEISIDLVDAFLPRPVTILLQLIASISSLCMFVFLTWAMINPAHDAYQWGGFSLELGIPVWWQWAIAYAGMAGILWVCLQRVWREFSRFLQFCKSPRHCMKKAET